MTPAERVAQIKERLKNSTPGPWWIGRFQSYRGDGQPIRCVYRPIEGETRIEVEGSEKIDCDADAQLIANAPTDLKWCLDRIEKLEKHLTLALSFCPKGPVPKGLGPTFYHTLNYEDECKLQAKIDEARAALGGE